MAHRNSNPDMLMAHRSPVNRNLGKDGHQRPASTEQDRHTCLSATKQGRHRRLSNMVSAW